MLGKAQCEPVLSVLVLVLVVMLARESRVIVHITASTIESFILRLLSIWRTASIQFMYCSWSDFDIVCDLT